MGHDVEVFEAEREPGEKSIATDEALNICPSCSNTFAYSGLV
jgi:hypothetical protein